MNIRWYLFFLISLLILVFQACDIGFDSSFLSNNKSTDLARTPTLPILVPTSKWNDSTTINPTVNKAWFKSSSSFGLNGELWNQDTADSQLPDFSFAGYHMGQQPLPKTINREIISVLDFGAIANDGLDDSAAIIAAINSVAGQSKVVYVPDGIYHLMRVVKIENQGKWVLRGESKSGTVLQIDKPGCTLDNDCNGSQWRWGKGFIQVIGDLTPPDSLNIEESIISISLRGSNKVTLTAGSEFRVGDRVRLTQVDPAYGANAGGLQKHLHGDLIDNPVNDLSGEMLFDFISNIIAVATNSEGTVISFDRNLPINVNPLWAAKISTISPTVEEVGIENLTFSMKHTYYPGHLKEQGYNAIEFKKVLNSWIKDVLILNSDVGIALTKSHFNTITDVQLETTASRGSTDSHHSLSVAFGGDNLFTRFQIGLINNDISRHELTVDWHTRNNVFSNGYGYNLAMDHHRSGSYQNLFSNIHTGLGTRAFASGGTKGRGSHTAAYATFWNIRGGSASSFDEVSCSFGGGFLNFIGLPRFNSCDSLGWNLERINPYHLVPQNLHLAQLAIKNGAAIPQLDDFLRPYSPLSMSQVFELSSASDLYIEAEFGQIETNDSAAQWLYQSNGQKTYILVPDGASSTRCTVENITNGDCQRIDYPIKFSVSGTFFVWVLGRAPSGSSDSLHIGFNGKVTAAKLSSFATNYTWGWSNQKMGNQGTAKIYVDQLGIHNLSVWVREDGLEIDKIFITQSATKKP